MVHAGRACIGGARKASAQRAARPALNPPLVHVVSILAGRPPLGRLGRRRRCLLLPLPLHVLLPLLLLHAWHKLRTLGPLQVGVVFRPCQVSKLLLRPFLPFARRCALVVGARRSLPRTLPLLRRSFVALGGIVEALQGIGIALLGLQHGAPQRRAGLQGVATQPG